MTKGTENFSLSGPDDIESALLEDANLNLIASLNFDQDAFEGIKATDGSSLPQAQVVAMTSSSRPRKSALKKNTKFGGVNFTEEPAKRIDDFFPDDDTIDSEYSDPKPPPRPSLKKRKKNRLTAISAMYDLDGSGELDEIEQAMRDADKDGDGNLSKREVYAIVQEQLKNKKDARQLRKIVVGLACFVFILALSNLGTSFASAILARETTADAETATITMKSTGDSVGTQSTGENIDMDALDDDQRRNRRAMVLEELASNPYGHHQHRRMAKNNTNKNKNGKNTRSNNCRDRNTICDDDPDNILFDSGVLDVKIAEKLLKKCDGSRTINLVRKWDDGSTDSEPICRPGTSVVKKNTGGNKNIMKNVKNGANTMQMISFVSSDGKATHMDCDGKFWYVVILF